MSGGSQEYITKILEDSDNLVVKTSMNLETVQRGKEGITLCFRNGEKKSFDKLIFATHFDEALNLLQNPTHTEREILSTSITLEILSCMKMTEKCL